MRQYYWKIVLCLIPCLLAGWVTALASYRYYQGEPGGFKFGVDLVGGTILVYEIDMTKQLERDKSDPQRDTHLLAESLKRRIDPNDLFNIVIRPAGGEGRVEIILPTGGTHRAEKAEKEWKDLLEQMQERYKVGKKFNNGTDDLEVGRGRILELANAIHIRKSQAVWASPDVFGSPDGWSDFLKQTYNRDKFPALKNPQEPQYTAMNPLAWLSLTGRAAVPSTGMLSLLNESSAGGDKGVAPTAQLFHNTWKMFELTRQPDLKKFKDTLTEQLREGTSERSIEAWIKEQAWEKMLDRARQRWPQIQPTLFDVNNKADQEAKKDLGALGFKATITPDSHEEMVGFVQTRGNLLAAAGLAVLEPLLGKEILLSDEVLNRFGEDKKAEWKRRFETHDAADKFINQYYGPSLHEITTQIETEYKKTGRSKDLTVEEVQRIKELVSKVGSLEFRILANETDDAEAIKAAKDYFADPRNAAKLKEARVRGEPPPGPRVPGTDQPRIFTINLPRGAVSKVTYSWVELGPPMRKQEGLDNASETSPEPGRYKIWQQAKNARVLNVATEFGLEGRKLLHGALFYSRVSENQNLPEEERKAKAIEYFVLTRDPEFDEKDPSYASTPTRRVPKVDGSYLTQAAADRTGVSPSVHFVFNATGGELFGNLTRKNVPDTKGGVENKRHLAIVLDGLIQSAPHLSSEIRERGQITGHFTQREVESLVNILRAGALPASLKPQPVSESTIGSTLGADTIEKGVTAVIWAFAAVVIFMIIYYRFAGLVASLALTANLVLTVGFMIAVQATFTLPGLAGLVLMLGMAVDANVLIYERLREERERGASLILALRNGYERALPTIIDTHLSSIFTAIVLYIVGNDQLKGFGVSLTVGLIISLFTSLFMTRVIFDIWQLKGWLTKLSMMKFFSKPDIDFMGLRYVFFSITIGVSILGVTAFVARGTDGLNIDFRGGTAYSGRLKNGKALNITELRDLVDTPQQEKHLQVKDVLETAEGREFKIIYSDGEEVSVSLANRVEAPSEADRRAIIKRRAGQLPDAAVEQIFPSPTAVERLGLTDPKDSGRSYFFTVRSSEKETELVQAAIDRLFRDKEGSLMQRVFMRSEPVGRTGFYLRFFNTDDEKKVPKKYDRTNKPDEAREADKYRDYASPSFVKTLLNREFMRDPALVEVNPAEKTRKLKFNIDVTGEGESRDGRYAAMKISFTPSLDLLKERDASINVKEIEKKIEAALGRVRAEFEKRPQPERLENFDSALAAETRFRALWAILASWGAILLYLWFRFGNWTFGLAAVLCLIHDLFFTLGAIAACHYVFDTWWGQALQLEDFKLDLNAVAALLTLVGYSVNDTIVVFDRVREVRGKNPDLTPQMINDSVNQTLSRTLLASLTTWLVVAVLYWWGGPGVHLFAFVMVIGVIVGTYSSIYIASPLLLIFGEGAAAAEAARGRPAPTRPEPAPA